MQLNVIKVGNSKGLRLPKSVLDAYNIEHSVELKFREGYIELRPVESVRVNWKEKFVLMSKDPDEEQMIPDIFEDEEL